MVDPTDKDDATGEVPVPARQPRQDARIPAGPARSLAIDRRIAQMPLKSRSTYRRAVSGRSRGAGIKAFCQECCAHDRAAIRDCTALACPLYPYRPYREVR